MRYKEFKDKVITKLCVMANRSWTNTEFDVNCENEFVTEKYYNGMDYDQQIEDCANELYQSLYAPIP